METAARTMTDAELERERTDNLRHAALEQAVRLAAARPEMQILGVVDAAEKFFAFLVPAPVKAA